MHSPLTNKIILASPNNYSVGRAGYKVCKITPHHMAAIWTAERCAESFQNPSRGASANYCIGYDGTIVCNVDEVNRAWTSSNGVNDCQAITIEVANSTGAPTWQVSDAAWNSLVKLCADICERYGFRLSFDGTPNGSLTMHKMFAATSCPGPYLEARMPQLAREVNAILDGNTASTPSQPTNQNGSYEAYNGFVEVTYGGAEGLTIHSKPSWDANTSAGTVKKGAVFTVVGRQLVGGVYMYKLKSGAWITSAPEYVSFRTTLHADGSGGSASKPSTPSKSVAQLAKEVIEGKWGIGQDRKNRLTAAGYDYNAVQAEVNRQMGASTSPTMTARQFALEVWNEGKHGTGATRQAEAKKYGVDYSEVQRLINILASGGRI